MKMYSLKWREEKGIERGGEDEVGEELEGGGDEEGKLTPGRKVLL